MTSYFSALVDCLSTKSPIQNIYIKKVEKKKMFDYDKDELWNTVIKTYPPSARSGPMIRRSSWPSGSTAAISRPASTANSDDHDFACDWVVSCMSALEIAVL